MQMQKLLCILLEAPWAWHSHAFLPLVAPTLTLQTTGATRRFQGFVHTSPSVGTVFSLVTIPRTFRGLPATGTGYSLLLSLLPPVPAELLGVRGDGH